MGTWALKQLLESFCNDSYWNYAVFWKIEYLNRGILSWEDGYCDFPNSERQLGVTTENFYLNDKYENVSSCSESNIHNGDSESRSMELAVADMSYLQYPVGEGTVGRVVESGNHSWVFLEDIFTSEVLSTSNYEGPNEWLIQYALGIKTVLLVPVQPFGVLQLGSLQMVNEDLSVVAYLKDRCSALHFFDETAANVAWSHPASVLSSLFESLDEQSTPTANMLEIENYEIIEDIKPIIPTFNQFVPHQEDTSASRKIRPYARHTGKGLKYDIEAMNLKEQFATLNESFSSNELEMGDEKLFELFSLETQSSSCAQLKTHDTNLFEAGVLNYSADNMVRQQFGHNFVTRKDYEIADNFFGFPNDCELRKVLGPTFQVHKETSKFSHESPSSITESTSNLICNRDFNTDDIGHFLEAMIADGHDNLDSLSNNPVNGETSLMSGKFAYSAQQFGQSESSTIIVDDSAPWIFPESAVFSTGRKTLTSLSASNSLVLNEQDENSCDKTEPRKGMKKMDSNRRTKITANPKQRPRDRQLIQDRIKELREIVPNGARCSIDGLLEKTIKHMLYLQRVTDQAEKLKQMIPQDSDLKNTNAVRSCSFQPNGTSWAFDIESDLQVCPIVVEDLEYPGHMLIEMLCNDTGFFLEIAQAIRLQDLTILKGVIEHRSNNSWAHFIVETPRGFHRMDVFWPLMHLLQCKRNPISSRGFEPSEKA